MTKDMRREIEKLLMKEERGLLITEIAESLKVHRHTARKYVDILASDERILRRKVGTGTVCYPRTRRLVKNGLKACLWVCLISLAAGSGALALSDCTGTAAVPCHQCDVYGINISLHYPNGSLAAYTLNQTPVSVGSCTCTCYTADCCATDTYKNYSAAWGIGYTVCPVEGDYNASIEANATQAASEWEGPSANFTVYTVNWDTDEDWCECKVGTGRWNIGFGPGTSGNCCGDDSEEYNRTRLCDGTACTADPTDDACCNASNACVWSSGCYLDGYSHPALGGVLCEDGTWVGGAPQWRNQGTNDTDNVIPPGGTINLTAEGFDDGGLDYAWLETNESGGTWINYTGSYGGNYGSPMDMGDAATWAWSNFTWSNASIVAGTDTAWKIWYNDTSNNLNATSTLLFLADNIPYVDGANITPVSPTHQADLDLYVTCSDADAGASLTAYWNWWKNGALQAGTGGSGSVSNGTATLVGTLGHVNTSGDENWTAEVFCGDGFANSSTSNTSVIILPVPEYTLQVTLTINGTENSVYAPGTGALSAGSIGSLTSSPGDYYLASYDTSALYGLVHFYQTPWSLTASNTQDNHSLVINSSIKNSNIFLVFTRGDWRNVFQFINLIEAGTFLLKPLPSFAYGLGVKNRVRAILRYTDIDISGIYAAGRGDRSVTLINQNVVSKAVNISVS
jgi:hypothetical protein